MKNKKVPNKKVPGTFSRSALLALATVLAIGGYRATALAQSATDANAPAALAPAELDPSLGQFDRSAAEAIASLANGGLDPVLGEAGSQFGDSTNPGAVDFITAGPDEWTSPRGLNSTLQVMLLLTVLSLAPAILLMTTSFIRIVVVLSLLRQALGTQQLPPGQVITAIALFMTALIMTPVWSEVYNNSIRPYTDPNVEMSLEQAWDAGVKPVRQFMSKQILMAGNSDDVWLFFEYMPPGTPEPQTFDEVPLQVLVPAFMLSELKIAFLIGFQIYLPFLILDLVVASVTISMGMLMLPPVMISLPFKLLLFVLVDGWNLVVGMLLASFAPYT